MSEAGNNQETKNSPDFDAVVVGAGFGGMYMSHLLRARGLKVQGFERGGGVGGTWYWNRYPGCRCDVESMEYSYQFSPDLQQDWEWSERYSAQPEILAYAQHVAQRFDIDSIFRFNTAVTGAAYDDQQHLWRVSTDQGDEVTARNVIMATGCLSTANEESGAWHKPLRVHLGIRNRQLRVCQTIPILEFGNPGVHWGWIRLGSDGRRA